ncbi:MAG: aldo/keto reductase [Candidatus Lokiarchaeota archaeon]|nr:aldo/keto reductase [Candidatus Lokiarchaeota archaeon]MBD3199521.1 aldo/keto reductase [Candidatus Lokiarchaeota archaeon]
MRRITFGNTSEKIPILGQGTYGIFPDQSEKNYENWRKVLRRGIELGMTHIDTAEMYGDGYSEKIVGEVAKEYEREDLFITTKMLPSRKTDSQMERAINKSLERLDMDYVDLYLIHWIEGDSNLKKIMKNFETFINKGKTRYIGVSNFSVDQVKEAQKYLKEYSLETNQVKFNIIIQDQLKKFDYYKKNNITITAYTPLAKGNLNGLPNEKMGIVEGLADKYNSTKLQITLSWVINQKNVIAIPRTSNIKHLEENTRASNINLTDREIKKLSIS